MSDVDLTRHPTLPTPVVIDCDPGIDDAIALAIALFSPEISVRLVTSVAGNVSIDKTTRNALAIETYLGTTVPVAAGAFGPLLRLPIDASDVHGDEGLGGWAFPEPSDELLSADCAVDALYRTIRMSPDPVTMVCIGPLTNAALLLKVHPDVVGRLGRIVCMGGAISGGNVTPHAEFNVASDPEAAAITFSMCSSLGIPLTLVPMEIGQKCFVTREDMRRACMYTVTGKMAWNLYDHYRSSEAIAGRDGKEMYDPSTIAFVLRPSMFTVRRATVEVQLLRYLEEGAGSTLFDFDGEPSWEAPAVDVVTDVDASSFVAWFVEALGRCV